MGIAGSVWLQCAFPMNTTCGLHNIHYAKCRNWHGWPQAPRLDRPFRGLLLVSDADKLPLSQLKLPHSAPETRPSFRESSDKPPLIWRNYALPAPNSSGARWSQDLQVSALRWAGFQMQPFSWRPDVRLAGNRMADRSACSIGRRQSSRGSCPTSSARAGGGEARFFLMERWRTLVGSRELNCQLTRNRDVSPMHIENAAEGSRITLLLQAWLRRPFVASSRSKLLRPVQPSAAKRT